MRILEVTLHDGTGGAETLINSLATEFGRRKHDVKIAPLETFGASRSRAKRALTLRRTIVAFRPDIIHAHTALPNAYVRALTRGRIPVVTTLHSVKDFENPLLRIAERGLTRWTSAVVAVSERSYEEYLRRFPAMSDRTRTIPNGIRNDLPIKREYRSRPAALIDCARLTEAKDLETLLDGFSAWTQAHQPSPRCELIIAGGGGNDDYETRVRRKAKELVEAGFNIRLLGSRDDVPKLLAEADAFVHSAKWEAHPIAVLEAMAVGLPCIVTEHVATTTDIPQPYRTFKNGSADDLCLALDRLHANYAEAITQAQSIRMQTRETFSIHACASEYLDLFSSVLSKSTE